MRKAKVKPTRLARSRKLPRSVIVVEAAVCRSVVAIGVGWGGAVLMRDAFCVLFAALADRCCEFIAWSDRELDRGLSRAIFLHVGDKCQTVGGSAGCCEGRYPSWRQFTGGRRKRCSVGAVA
jgi:hypothetical protein